MPPIADQAIVLGRLDFSETSQVLAVFSRDHGKLRVIAKGIKRSTRQRFAVGIDLLEVGGLVVSARGPGQTGLIPLVEWKQRMVFSGLRESLSRMYSAQYAAEVTAGLTEDWDPHPLLYDCLLNFMGELAECANPGPLTVAFLRRLLEEAGSLPRFDSCIGCGQPATEGSVAYFSSFDGGPICRDCEGAYVEKHSLKTAALAALQGIPAGRPGEAAAAFEVLNYHIAHLMGRQPRLADKLAWTRADLWPAKG